MKNFLRLNIVSAILAIGIFANASGAYGDVLVLTSTDVDIAAGDILLEGEQIAISEGAQVGLLFEDGRELTIVGAAVFVHPEADRVASESDLSVLSKLSIILKKMEGERRLGAIRGDDECEALQPLLTWSDIAQEWSNGCKVQAVKALDVEIAKRSN